MWSLQIEALVDGFRGLTLPLPKERWTHEAHLTVGAWFHKTHAEFEAICYLRSSIIAYNVSVGGKNTPEGGYHETLTLFWSRVIRYFVSAHKHLSLLELCNTFLDSPLASRELPLTYYTRETLFSTKARAVWVEPDLGNHLALVG